MLGEVLVVFFNRFSLESKYPVEDSENFELTIKIQVSEKTKSFFSTFCSICGIYVNFKHFEKVDDCHS